MGRKVRSLHPARPFNRQIACVNANIWSGSNRRNPSLGEEGENPDEEDLLGLPSGENLENKPEQVRTPVAEAEQFAFLNRSDDESCSASDDVSLQNDENDTKTPDSEINSLERKISSTLKTSDKLQPESNGNGDQTPKAVSPTQRGLMWTPKVNKKGLDNFLNNER